VHPRVGPAIPDGKYKLVPQVEEPEEQPQEGEVAAAEVRTPQLTDLSATQAEGKPRCILPYFKKYSHYVYKYLCIKFRS
jgi:hypothetical protein